MVVEVEFELVGVVGVVEDEVELGDDALVGVDGAPASSAVVLAVLPGALPPVSSCASSLGATPTTVVVQAVTRTERPIVAAVGRDRCRRGRRRLSLRPVAGRARVTIVRRVVGEGAQGRWEANSKLSRARAVGLRDRPGRRTSRAIAGSTRSATTQRCCRCAREFVRPRRRA